MNADKNLFYRGMPLSLTVSGSPYNGIITSCEKGKGLVVKINKVDMKITQVLPNSELMVKLIAEDGNAYVFKSRLKERKIPMLTLSYPEGELQGVKVRKVDRVDVSFWAELKMVKTPGVGSGAQPETVGDANIADMGIGGCKIMTQQALKKGEPVWVEFTYGEKEEPVQLKGIVRSSKPGLYESTYYGLQFCDLGARETEIINKILENPQG